MARLVLTILALVFISCIVADSDSSESENESVRRRNDNRDVSDSYEDSSVEVSHTVSGTTEVKLPSGKTAHIKNHADKMKRSSQCRRADLSKILLALEPSDEEYKLMENEMQSTILVQSNSSVHFSKYNISKIERVINGCVMKRYRRRQISIKSETRYLNERILFAAVSNALSVPVTGFNEIHANMHGNFGPGLYFTEYSSISNQFALPLNDSSCMTCERKIIICRVTLGNIYKATHATPLYHSPVGYHSVHGEASPEGLKYNEYVIYRGEQAYPDYLITYTLIP